MATVNAVNTYIVPTTANEVTQPSQPAFLAYLGSQDNNVTGNGTNYVIGTNIALTEVFDQNNDFNTNGTFTAPVSGRYCFSFSCYAINITNLMTQGEIWMDGSNRDFYVFVGNLYAMNNPGSSGVSITGTAMIDMDASDTMTFNIDVAGGPGDTIDLAISRNGTSMSGYLCV